jgi:C4-dicarboxylate transporter DctM subunit
MGIYIYVTARRLGIREGGTWSLSAIGSATRNGAWALGTPLIILGGIYTGVFSPTEAAGVACLYAIVVTLLIYRDLTLAGLWKVTTSSVYLTAQVLIIVGAATLLARLLTIAGVPQAIVDWIQHLGLAPWLVMLAINLLLLAVGCVLDPASAILVLAPILKPVAEAAGIDPVHFGVVMAVNLSIGMFTPPFGLNIFVAQAMFKVPVRVLYRGLAPMIAVNLVALAIITYWPPLTLALVRILG